MSFNKMWWTLSGLFLNNICVVKYYFCEGFSTSELSSKIIVSHISVFTVVCQKNEMCSAVFESDGRGFLCPHA